MILHNIYFSAKGTIEMCAGCIGQGLNLQMKPYNWFEKPCNEKILKRCVQNTECQSCFI